jgi:hypothetical protein
VTFKPFSDDQLQSLDERFGAIHVYTPEPRPVPAWKAKTGAMPEPAFSLVFRACVPGEWDNITAQASAEKGKARAPRNLAMATIVAVSVDGTHTIHAGEPGGAANDRAASKPPRDALEALMGRPGCVGIPEAVADDLAMLNGVIAQQAEK